MTPQTDAIIAYLNQQFPATVGHLPLRRMIGQIERQLSAAKSVLWMAEKYAEAGGSNGPEMREYKAVMKVLDT